MKIRALLDGLEVEEPTKEHLLFRDARPVAPRPWDAGTLMLLVTNAEVGEEIETLLEGSPWGVLMKMLSRPVLFMKRESRQGYCYGSGWAFCGGSESKGGTVQNKAYTESVVKVRYLSFEMNRLANSLLTMEYMPGVVFFKLVREQEDGRRNQHVEGVINQQTEEVTVSSVSCSWKSCDYCASRSDICLCEERTLSHHFANARRRLRATTLSESAAQTTAMGTTYVRSWLSGRRMLQTGRLPPVRMDVMCLDSGDVFEDAVKLAVQEEVRSIMSPHASARFSVMASEKQSRPRAMVISALVGPSDTDGPVAASSAAAAVAPAASVKGVICETCGSRFPRRYELRRHIQGVHEKRKDHTCRECSKSFAQKGHLNEHIRVSHEGDRSHKCPSCDKFFSSRSKVTRHVHTVHDNIRSYTCELCNKNYKEKSYLKQHRALVHGGDQGAGSDMPS